MTINKNKNSNIPIYKKPGFILIIAIIISYSVGFFIGSPSKSDKEKILNYNSLQSNHSDTWSKLNDSEKEQVEEMLDKRLRFEELEKNNYINNFKLSSALSFFKDEPMNIEFKGLESSKGIHKYSGTSSNKLVNAKIIVGDDLETISEISVDFNLTMAREEAMTITEYSLAIIEQFSNFDEHLAWMTEQMVYLSSHPSETVVKENTYTNLSLKLLENDSCLQLRIKPNK